jgi:(E)-4-hydroxy-3-methylbut-2-enyl-diphosphate synthase
VVNGPGEARETDVGLTGGGEDQHMVYVGGSPDHRIGTPEMVEHIVELVEAKAREIEALKAANG